LGDKKIVVLKRVDLLKEDWKKMGVMNSILKLMTRLFICPQEALLLKIGCRILKLTVYFQRYTYNLLDGYFLKRPPFSCKRK